MLYKVMENMQLSPTLNLSRGSVIDTDNLSEKDAASVKNEVHTGRGYLVKVHTVDTEASRSAVAAMEAAALELTAEADEAILAAAAAKEAAAIAIAEAAAAKEEAEAALAEAEAAKEQAARVIAEAAAAKEEAEAEEKAAKKAAKKAKEEGGAAPGTIPRRDLM